jgi:hypothetical protein
MAARIQDDFENGGRMFVIEIRGDIYRKDRPNASGLDPE